MLLSPPIMGPASRSSPLLLSSAESSHPGRHHAPLASPCMLGFLSTDEITLRGRASSHMLDSKVCAGSTTLCTIPHLLCSRDIINSLVPCLYTLNQVHHPVSTLPLLFPRCSLPHCALVSHPRSSKQQQQQQQSKDQLSNQQPWLSTRASMVPLPTQTVDAVPRIMKRPLTTVTCHKSMTFPQIQMRSSLLKRGRPL